MIIAKTDTFPFRIPFKPGIQAAASAWGNEGLPVADSLLVRVTTDQGLEGWGETFGFRAVPLVRAQRLQGFKEWWRLFWEECTPVNWKSRTEDVDLSPDHAGGLRMPRVGRGSQAKQVHI
jgi:hypothetical protein